MTRNVLGVIAGLAGWLIIAAVAGLIMRSSWPAYASVADSMTFTLPMMIARRRSARSRRSHWAASPRSSLDPRARG